MPDDAPQPCPDEGTPAPHGGREFVGEPLTPADGPQGRRVDAAAMASGAPGLPRRFRSRSGEFEVARVLARWRTTGGCHSGSRERYVRRHWYRVRTTAGEELELYFDRQPRTRRRQNRRWWLYTRGR